MVVVVVVVMMMMMTVTEAKDRQTASQKFVVERKLQGTRANVKQCRCSKPQSVQASRTAGQGEQKKPLAWPPSWLRGSQLH